MITFDKTHIQITEDEITPRKINAGIIKFNSPVKGILYASLDGYEITHTEDTQESILTLVQKNMLNNTFSLLEFADKNILTELHLHFTNELQKVNPNVTFTTTL